MFGTESVVLSDVSPLSDFARGGGEFSGVLCSSLVTSRKELRVGVFASGSGAGALLRNRSGMDFFLSSFLTSSDRLMGVLVCVEDVVLLLVLDFETSLIRFRLLRGREWAEPTSDSSSSVVSGADRAFHLETRRSTGPRRSVVSADSSYRKIRLNVEKKNS